MFSPQLPAVITFASMSSLEGNVLEHSGRDSGGGGGGENELGRSGRAGRPWRCCPLGSSRRRAPAFGCRAREGVPAADSVRPAALEARLNPRSFQPPPPPRPQSPSRPQRVFRARAERGQGARLSCREHGEADPPAGQRLWESERRQEQRYTGFAHQTCFSESRHSSGK